MYAGERFNSYSHMAGLLLAIGGAVALIAQALGSGSGSRLLSFTVFGITMVTLYLASTMYHSLRTGPRKDRWAKVDHCAIYLFIAGTYTPFTMITLRNAGGYWMLAVVWLLAIVGIVKELVWGRERWPSVPLYLGMGWVGLVAILPLVHHLQPSGAACLFAGGLLYTIGVLFYAKDQAWAHAHGIWHLFVLAGTGCHFVTVMYFVR